MKLILSDQDRGRLDALIAKIEKRTNTQIVLAVIQRSDVYADLPWKAFALGRHTCHHGDQTHQAEPYVPPPGPNRSVELPTCFPRVLVFRLHSGVRCSPAQFIRDDPIHQRKGDHVGYGAEHADTWVGAMVGMAVGMEKEVRMYPQVLVQGERAALGNAHDQEVLSNEIRCPMK